MKTTILALLTIFSPLSDAANAAPVDEQAGRFCASLLNMAAGAPKPSLDALGGDTRSKIGQLMQLQAKLTGLDPKAKAAVKEKKTFRQFVEQQKTLGTEVPSVYESFYLQSYSLEWCGRAATVENTSFVNGSRTAKKETTFEKSPDPADHPYSREAIGASGAQ